MTVLMKKYVWSLVSVACAAMVLTGCGSKETKEALQKTTALEDQKQFQDANAVLVEALRAREVKIRADNAVPNDPAEADALTKKVQSDPEILKLECAQIPIYLHLERADLASAIYSDILDGHGDGTVIYDELHDKDPLMRTGAARVLGLMGRPEAIDALTQATKDEDKDVRRAAVAALGTIKDPKTVGPLLAALKDSYWFVRSEAANSLGQERDLRAIKPLLDTVADSDDTVESSAETALLILCRVPGASTDEFAARLNDPNPKIVLISSVCLALLKDHRAIPVLLKLSSAPDLPTRLEAIKALGEAGDPSVIPTLRQTLKDPDVNIRGWSIIGLGTLKDEGSLADLRAIMADTNESPKIQAAAAAAIEHITGTAQASPPSGP